MFNRRTFLLAAATLASTRAVAAVDYPVVAPRTLVFPRDHGAHPDFRIEWWYLTGWLDAPGRPSIGFQVTFFRNRPDIDSGNPSSFAAKQLLIAHAAIADSERQSLLHDQQLARSGFGAASAATADTEIALGRWRFARRTDGLYECSVPARGFTLEFEARPTQPLLLQGDRGYSRKGPLTQQASFYYSQPQLAVRARLTRDNRVEERTGSGWLDHEWSSAPLADDAAGWDWLGMNLADGGALTAFQVRRRDATADSPPQYAYASLRQADQSLRLFSPAEVRSSRITTWTSPRTRAVWPVAQEWSIGEHRFQTVPLMVDQELDSRSSSSTVYWEGASHLLAGDRPVGRGYLEMTGYAAPIRL